MSPLLVDESYCFDYLSILHTKDLNNNTVKNRSNFEDCFNYLKLLFGEQKIYEIYGSQEYCELLSQNKAIFHAIDEMRKNSEDKITDYGRMIDRYNLIRFELKQKLQRKFFNTDITETKLTYE